MITSCRCLLFALLQVLAHEMSDKPNEKVGVKAKRGPPRPEFMWALELIEPDGDRGETRLESCPTTAKHRKGHEHCCWLSVVSPPCTVRYTEIWYS